MGKKATRERENRGHRGEGKLWARENQEHRESPHRGTGKPWASRNCKTMGIHKPGPPGSCSIGKLGNRGLQRAAAPGNREHQGASKSWAQENREDQAPLAWGTGSSVQPGTGSIRQPQHREAAVLGKWENSTAAAPGNWEHQDHHLALGPPARPGTGCGDQHQAMVTAAPAEGNTH